MVRARLLLTALVLLLAAPAYALESAAVTSPRMTATLVSDTDAVAPGQPLQVGLRLRIAPGWHTYWQNPGDAGAPPELTLTLPEGAAAGAIQWPTPQRLPEGPVMTYGYTGEVLLPVTLEPSPGALHIEAAATWLVCERICVPEEGRFTLDLPPGRPAPSAEAPLFAAAAARIPRPSPFEARIAPDGTLALSGSGLSPATVRDAWFFPSAADMIENAAAQTVRVRDGAVTLQLKPASAFNAKSNLGGVVVLRDPGGQESSLQLDAAPGPVASATPLPQTLLLAALGGLILNLMPCVFPVLAMKAMAIARLSGAARGAIRAHALSYTLGVLVAFGALGAILAGGRAAGGAVGWGFQFQSPMFVAVLACVLFGVGLNLSGVFSVGGRLAGAGQGLASKDGHAGSFFTGLLAVVVATPCTAPFMGAAIAAALAASPATTIAVFLAMGLGLAAPYAALATLPGLARALPRPGPWMEVLRGALAFPMYGAAAWLVWVISLQAGPAGVLATVAGLVLLGFAAWSLGLAQAAGPRGRRLGRGVALAATLAVAVILAGIATIPPGAMQTATEGTEPFSAARLATLRNEGRPVFVNMTAAWCVTCLVNERLALAPAAVQRSFADHNVAYLKGDWTRGDPEITAFLRSHARDGVPLYVLYPPSPATPAVLPQILTEAAMLDQLAKLGS
jgi:thiol:disulfide interchange protein